MLPSTAVPGRANSADLALSRLITCIAMAGVEQSERAVSRNIAEVVNIIVQLERRAGKRRVVQVLEVNRYQPESDRFGIESHEGLANYGLYDAVVGKE